MTRAAAVCARGQRVRSKITTAQALRCDPFEDLSYQICHELRTPLNAVIGFSDLMRSELLGPVGNARYREYLDHISDSAQRMLCAAEETLNITALLAAPKSVGEAKPFNLSAAVVRAADHAANDNGNAIPQVFIDMCPTTEVWGDDETVVSALCSLIRAAAVASPGANQIAVAASRIKYDTVSLIVHSSPVAQECKAHHRTRKGGASEGELLTALAISLLDMQGVTAEPDQSRPGTYAITIEFELSAQQALAL